MKKEVFYKSIDFKSIFYALLFGVICGFLSSMIVNAASYNKGDNWFVPDVGTSSSTPFRFYYHNYKDTISWVNPYRNNTFSSRDIVKQDSDYNNTFSAHVVLNSDIIWGEYDKGGAYADNYWYDFQFEISQAQSFKYCSNDDFEIQADILIVGSSDSTKDGKIVRWVVSDVAPFSFFGGFESRQTYNNPETGKAEEIVTPCDYYWEPHLEELNVYSTMRLVCKFHNGTEYSNNRIYGGVNGTQATNTQKLGNFAIVDDTAIITACGKDVNFGSSSDTPDINVDVDMSETNEKLDTLNDSINKQTEQAQKNHDEFMNADISDKDKEQPDDSSYKDYEDSENALLDKTKDVDMSSIDVGIDGNSSNFIWDTLTSLMQSHAKVFAMFIGVLSIGIIKLALGR